MKIENLERARQLQQQLKDVLAALKETTEFLNTKTKNVPGHGTSGENGLYQLHISEYRDGSGLNIDLTNCEIGVDVVEAVLPLLEGKKAAIEAEIKTL